MIPSGNYLLLGRTGVGKSSVINAVAQDNIAKTSLEYACTKEIKCCQIDTPCGEYVFYDSPGFCEDDNPLTDKKYFEKLADFLAEYLQDGNEISLLLVARLGQTRFRTEDFEVIKYLADILHRFHLPVVFVATWADFQKGCDHVRSQLDLLRVQILLSLDEALLKMSSRKMCAAGFNGAFAVDNNSSTWLASWKPIAVRLDPQLDSTSGFENLLGHSKKSIFDWVVASGHDPGEIVQHGVTHLLDNRIYNLTAYPYEGQLSDLISASILPVTSCQEQFCRARISGSSCEVVDALYIYTRNIFRLKSTASAAMLLEKLPERVYNPISLFSQRLSSCGIDQSMCVHIVVLFAARQLAVDLRSIAVGGRIVVLSPEIIIKRLSVVGEVFVELFELMGEVFLSEELIAFVKESLLLPRRFSESEEIVLLHLSRVSSLLYMATLFSESACFPRSLDEYPQDYWCSLRDVVADAAGWIGESDGPCSGYSDLAKLLVSAEDLNDLLKLLKYASNSPSSFSALLSDAMHRLKSSAWLVSGYYASHQHQMHLAQQLDRSTDGDYISQQEYWPSWRDAEDPVDSPFINDYADIDFDCGYKDDSDYVE